MRKIIGLLICGISCFFASAYAKPINEHILTLGPTLEIELLPHEPQYFINSFIWTVRVNCTLLSNDPVIHLSFKVLRKSGSVNNTTVTKGDSVSMTFAPYDQVELAALSGGKVELVNDGETTVTASCYTL